MLRKTLQIQNVRQELEAVTEFIRLANGFKSLIRISREDGQASANVKSTLGLVPLGLQPGMTVTLEADGPDEEEAAERLSAFLS